MYTEGFEEFGDLEEKSPRRAYVSNVSQDDADSLYRENEKLKKALEKEQFFNKLLDQEIQELKSNAGHQESHYSSYWYGSKGVSKGAFFTLLFITLAMAAYIGYGIYYDKQFDYIKDISPTPSTTSDESATLFTTPSNENKGTLNSEAQPKSQAPVNSSDPVSSGSTVPPSSIPPPVTDSVPNIISKTPVEKKKNTEKQTVEPAQESAAATRIVERDVETERATTSNEPIDTRPVIARYQVSSKANFYSEPDENKMRSTFISSGEDKVVGALEDKNGFIYVVYTNDLGYTSRGWLSKKDLTKLD